MQGLDKNIITNVMAKIMENLFRSESLKGRLKYRQPFKLSKKTRLKIKIAARRVVGSAVKGEGTQTGVAEDDPQQRLGMQIDGEDTEGVSEEALNIDLGEDERRNETKGPPLIMLSRRSCRLEEKRGKQEYERGAVASLASRNKALLMGGNSGTNLLNLDVFDYMSHNILLDIAHTYEVDLEREGSEKINNLAFVWKVEFRETHGVQDSSKASRGD